MSLSLADQYYVRALDNYPYNLEFVIENLQYALSCDEEHVQALCLTGVLYMYHIKDYEEAKRYFHESLCYNQHYTDTYKHLSLLYLWLGRYQKAEKIISSALRIPGMDRCSLLYLLALSYEYKGNFVQAKDLLKKVKLMAVEKNCIDTIDTSLERVKRKLKSIKPKKS